MNITVATEFAVVSEYHSSHGDLARDPRTYRPWRMLRAFYATRQWCKAYSDYTSHGTSGKRTTNAIVLVGSLPRSPHEI